MNKYALQATARLSEFPEDKRAEISAWIERQAAYMTPTTGPTARLMAKQNLEAFNRMTTARIIEAFTNHS